MVRIKFLGQKKLKIDRHKEMNGILNCKNSIISYKTKTFIQKLLTGEENKFNNFPALFENNKLRKPWSFLK